MNFELNHIYCMDCMEAMKQIPDNYFSIGIIDPPYGIGEDGKKNHSRGNRNAGGVWYKPTFFKPYSCHDASPPRKRILTNSLE